MTYERGVQLKRYLKCSSYEYQGYKIHVDDAGAHIYLGPKGTRRMDFETEDAASEWIEDQLHSDEDRSNSVNDVVNISEFRKYCKNVSGLIYLDDKVCCRSLAKLRSLLSSFSKLHNNNFEIITDNDSDGTLYCVVPRI